MRILLLTPFLPYRDARAGAPQAIYDRLCLLAPHHDITVVTFAEPEQQEGIVDLQRLGVKVRYAVRRPATSGVDLWRKRLRLTAAFLFSRLPLLVTEFGSRRIRRLVERSTIEDEPDLLLVEHLLMAQYIPGARKDSSLPVIISDHDVDAGAGSVSRYLSPIARLMRRRWIGYAEGAWRRADALLVSSEADAAVVRGRVPSAKVEVAPFGIVPKATCCAEGEKRDDTTLLFVGNFDHPPNREAAVRLAKSILPAVRRSCPAARLLLVGKNPTSEVLALQTPGSGVEVLGEVPSVDQYLCTCALFVAPIYSGGGMRIKLMEAMMVGAPIVTTLLGARGLGGEDGKHMLVADGDRAFAQAVVSALSDCELRKRLGEEARNLSGNREERERRAAHLEEILHRYARQTHCRKG